MTTQAHWGVKSTPTSWPGSGQLQEGIGPGQVIVQLVTRHLLKLLFFIQANKTKQIMIISELQG